MATISERQPLGRFPRRNGVYEISPPQRFEGGEEANDASVGAAARRRRPEVRIGTTFRTFDQPAA